MRYEQERQDLYNLLTTSVMRSHRDIAYALGWPEWKVGQVLGTVRDYQSVTGWTVPHAPRGMGEHLYQAIELGQPNLTADEEDEILWGELSSVRATATEQNHIAEHYKTSAAIVGSSALSRRFRNFARNIEGAAAAAEQLAEDIGNYLVSRNSQVTP